MGGDAGVPEGKFALEYREGAPDRHFRTVVDDPEVIAAAFAAYAAGDDAWRSALSWAQC